MPERVKPPTSLRVEQAKETRRRILDAAARVFEEQGFGGTRIDDVADRAGVAVPTVYKVFTNKPTLLIGALDQALAGGDEGGIEQQAWFVEQLDEPDPVRQLQLIARNARRVCERAGTLLTVLRDGASADDVLAGAWARISADRIERSRRTASNLIAKAGGRVRGSRTDVALTLWSLTDPQLFATYTSASRSAAQYEAWLADILCRSVLD